MFMAKTIDVHNHLFPKHWVDFLGKRTEFPNMKQNGSEMIFYSHGFRCARIKDSGHYKPEARIDDMDRCGLETQIMSLTLPSVEELPLDEAVKWSQEINNYFAEVCQNYPGRLYAFATLPYQDVEESVKEIDRAFNNLGVKGISMFSNINFKPICSPEFYPIYAKAEEYGLPIFIHPAVPYTLEVMKQHRLVPSLYGFTLDTTMAVMGLISTGVLEKFPKLNLIHAHLGGVVPYLVQRMESCWGVTSGFFSDQEIKLTKTPSEYYKNQVYPDTMSAYLPAMRCCLDFVGPKHMCLGTDYAHGIGNWEQAIDFITQLNLSKEDTQSILWGNAAKICNIP
jgi:aminocarboxymuconate-semialdehyde decarboxylase